MSRLVGRPVGVGAAGGAGRVPGNRHGATVVAGLTVARAARPMASHFTAWALSGLARPAHSLPATAVSASAGRNYPTFWAYFETANEKYIHRPLSTSSFANLGRPRLDAARFLWAGVPSLSFITGGGGSTYYHTPGDNLDIITPEIMEDFAQLVFMAVVDMANQDVLNFRN